MRFSTTTTGAMRLIDAIGADLPDNPFFFKASVWPISHSEMPVAVSPLSHQLRFG